MMGFSIAVNACSSSDSTGPGNARSNPVVDAAAGAGGASNAGQSLFSDPTVPACTISSAFSDMRLGGTISGQPVSTDQVPGTYFETGRIYVPDTYRTDAGYQLRNDLDLHWNGKLADGQIMELTGGSVYVPAGQPGGDKTYCFAKGELAVYAADPMNAGRLFKFRLDDLSLNADCSGGSIPGELVGCIHRYNPTLPQ